MKNKYFIKNVFIFILILLMTALIVCSCKSSDDTEITDTSENEVTETEPVVSDTEATEDKIIALADNKKAIYTVICDETDADAKVKINEFVQALSEKTGAEFSKKTSDEVREYEILIGKVDREISETCYGSLTYSEYSVVISNKKICLNYYENTALAKMLNLFLEAVKETENGWGVKESLNIGGNLSLVGKNVPKVDNGEQYLSSVISAGEGNRMATFEGCAENTYSEYVNKLKTSGFSCYDDSNISDNLFSTYIKDKTQISLYWYPSKQTMKVIYGSKGYLPTVSEPSVTAVCEPSITQLGRIAADESYPNGAPGMSYVIQTSDGKYIIIDGGPVDTEKKDVKALYDFLVQKKPSSHEKPQIAAWIITHAHIDHTELATAFITEYGKSVDVETVAYNFPDFSDNIFTEGGTPLMNNATNFKFSVKNYIASAQTLVLHTGQQFWVGDAFIEILYTPENHAPAVFPTGNHTSIAFRVTVNDTSVMILGDSERSICEYMAEVYGSYLKSDILQVTHHGVNGGSLALYQNIDPDICFWAIDEDRFNSHTQIRGNSAWDYNKWILNDSIKTRTHYHTSETNTVKLT